MERTPWFFDHKDWKETGANNLERNYIPFLLPS